MDDKQTQETKQNKVQSAIPDNEITIRTKGGKLDIILKDKIRIDDLMVTLFTVQLQALKQTLPKEDDVNYQAIKEDLYDKYNAGASQLLATFAPDIEMRPELTAEAMLKAENEHIEKEYAKLNRESRRLAHKSFNKETRAAVKRIK